MALGHPPSVLASRMGSGILLEGHEAQLPCGKRALGFWQPSESSDKVQNWKLDTQRERNKTGAVTGGTGQV